jgi:signal transduction histidine kinase
MKLPFSVNNLRLVLLLQVALPVLMLLAVVLMISLSVVGEFVEERMQRDLRLVTRTIHLPVSQAVQRRDLAQLQNSMTSVFSQAEVYGAYLFNADGERLVSFGKVNPTRRQATEALRKVDNGEFAQYEQIRGRPVYSFFMPIFDQLGQPDGFLQVTRRRSDIDDELTSLRRKTWGGFILVSIVILGIIIFAHQRAIGTPLSHLLSSMRKVSAGNHKHRTTPQGPQELKQLASGLNGMLDAIEAAEKREASQRHAREKMAERLRHSETMAALGQLSAGVAHELGAPLTVVDGRANRLLRNNTDPEMKRELTTIREQVQRMTSIVEQLLSFGRSSRTNKQALQISKVIEQARTVLAEEGRNITISAGSEVTLTADPLSIEQALVNLMRNACQACPEGEVIVSWEVDTDNLYVLIDDAGPGIPASQSTEVFKPFVSSKQPGEGSGLGLAIVKRIMREHDGDITLSQSPLGGARFKLRFPLHSDGEAQS